MIRIFTWIRTYLGNLWWGLGNVAWALDVSANVILFGDRESVSARLGRLRNKRKAADVVCDVLDVIDSGHCEESKEYWDSKQEK